MDDPGGVGLRLGTEGRLELRRLIGEGASGAIWLAHDHKRDRAVAIKLLHTAGGEQEKLHARFLREGQRFGRIRHANLVRVIGLGYSHGQPYLVLEYVDGDTLWTLLEQNLVFEPEQALVIVRDIAAGLEAAHDAGVVHRDLKPANVMIRRADQRVKVLDFGIAKDLRAETNITRFGTYIGTPAYSAPEQIMGDEIDHRTDIYSLGVILYELLTGPLAVEGRCTTELFEAALEEQNIPLGSLHRQVSRPIALLIQRMTRRHPSRRPPDMKSVRSACDQLLSVLREQMGATDRTEIRGVLRELFDA
jgi:serine/threonine protein kinase